MPKGSPAGQLAMQQAAAANEGTVEDWTREATKVKYKLDKPIVSKTSDGRAVKLEMAIEIESFYRQTEWEAYTYQMELYKEELQKWFDFQSGKIGPDGKPIKKKKAKAKSSEAAWPAAPEPPAPRVTVVMAGGAHAPEVMNVQHGGESKAPEIKEPEEPKRPMTVMEIQLAEKTEEVREAIGDTVINYSTAQLNSTAGREAFKKALIEELNTVLEPHYGTVTNVIISDLVTS